MMYFLVILAQVADDSTEVAEEVAVQNPLVALGGLIAAGLLIVVITVIQIVLQRRQQSSQPEDDAQTD